MYIVNQLLKDFFYEERFQTIALVALSFIINIIQTSAISSTIAKLINSIKNNSSSNAFGYFTYFVVFSLVYLFFYYFYEKLQIHFLSKMHEWMREKMIYIILKLNNENLGNINFINTFNNINRLSSHLYRGFLNAISNFLPSLVFLIVIFGYFIFQDPIFGICFSLCNVCIILYIISNWDAMLNKSYEYEKQYTKTESSIIEVLNNTDKIIHRGQIPQEMQRISGDLNDSVQASIDYHSLVSNEKTVSNVMVHIVVFISTLYMISQYFNKNIDEIFFITFLSIIILYRDRMDVIMLNIGEVIQKQASLQENYKVFLGKESEYDSLDKYKRDDHSLVFNKITFDRVSFNYPESDVLIFNNMSVSLDTVGSKIIGMNGVSGRGKSTFAKLLLKVYKLQEGDIYIDDVNIRYVDPDYLRKNIVYINQSGKLFDRLIADNMLYACNDDICKERLADIMSYDKIQGLFKNLDIDSALAGSLGENLSGGQRQVVNIISGLIHPSKIMILDEPTNALDGELKRDVINLILDFKKYKQCIFIITHDSEMDPIFDEVLKL